jgi:hypothetical protein
MTGNETKLIGLQVVSVIRFYSNICPRCVGYQAGLMDTTYYMEARKHNSHIHQLVPPTQAHTYPPPS